MTDWWQERLDSESLYGGQKDRREGLAEPRRPFDDAYMNGWNSVPARSSASKGSNA